MSQAQLEVTYRHGEAFAADVDSSGVLLGLELLAPQTTTAAEVQAVLAQYQAELVGERDLAPLRKAS